jgi:hypothetical protein
VCVWLGVCFFWVVWGGWGVILGVSGGGRRGDYNCYYVDDDRRSRIESRTVNGRKAD